MYEVLNLRSHDNKGLTYVFPEKEDRCWIHASDTKKLLKQPVLQMSGIRARYVFTAPPIE